MLGMALLLGHYAQVAEGGVIPYTTHLLGGQISYSN